MLFFLFRSKPPALKLETIPAFQLDSMRKNNQSHRTRPMNNTQHSGNWSSCPSCLFYLWRALVKQIDKSRNQFCRDNNVVLECASFSTNTHYPFQVTLSRQAHTPLHASPKKLLLEVSDMIKTRFWHKERTQTPRKQKTHTELSAFTFPPGIRAQTGQVQFCNRMLLLRTRCPGWTRELTSNYKLLKTATARTFDSA